MASNKRRRGAFSFSIVISCLASIVVYYEALVPAVEVLMIANPRLELLDEGLVCPLTLGMHSGTHIVQDTHDARGILGRTFPSESVCTTYL